MALISVTHTPTSAKARQFDGTLEAFLEILEARPKNNLSATCFFNAAGDFAGLKVGDVTLTIGDWIVFPDNPADPPIALSNADATTFWTAT